MPWGSFLHTGEVTVRTKTGTRRESTTQWRDMPDTPVPAPLARAGDNHVRAHIRDLTIVASRPTVPPPSHVETPSG